MYLFFPSFPRIAEIGASSTITTPLRIVSKLPHSIPPCGNIPSPASRHHEHDRVRRLQAVFSVGARPKSSRRPKAFHRGTFWSTITHIPFVETSTNGKIQQNSRRHFASSKAFTIVLPLKVRFLPALAEWGTMARQAE